MEEENPVSYASAVKLEERLNRAGILIGSRVEARQDGHFYRVVREHGPKLPGGLDSQQARIDVRTITYKGENGSGETYLITWGIGRDGPYISSERRRGYGQQESMGEVREGDLIHLYEILNLVVKERNRELIK